MGILIRDTETVALLDPDRREIRGGWVLVDGGIIEAVGPDPVSYTHLTLPTN